MGQHRDAIGISFIAFCNLKITFGKTASAVVGFLRNLKKPFSSYISYGTAVIISTWSSFELGFRLTA